MLICYTCNWGDDSILPLGRQMSGRSRQLRFVFSHHVLRTPEGASGVGLAHFCLKLHRSRLCRRIIAVPDDTLRAAVNLCGTKSGRDLDKFKAAGLTPIPSVHVRPPSIAECSINVECRIYTTIAAPHLLLTPEHRRAPVSKQHTIYFAEVLGAYSR